MFSLLAFSDSDGTAILRDSRCKGGQLFFLILRRRVAFPYPRFSKGLDWEGDANAKPAEVAGFFSILKRGA